MQTTMKGLIRIASRLLYVAAACLVAASLIAIGIEHASDGTRVSGVSK